MRVVDVSRETTVDVGSSQFMNVIVVTNQKGGVGKTTTAISLGSALVGKGLRVLLVDLDPQGNATSGLGVAKTRP